MSKLQELLNQTSIISKDVLIEKYCKNGETTVDEVYARVAKGLASVEKEEEREAWEKAFLAHMYSGGIGAGRIMSAAGTGINATLINCFRGDTIALTKQGPGKLKDLVGQTRDVVTVDGWRPATFQHFGKQELFEIIFENGQAEYATANHRWLVANRSRTGDLVGRKEVVTVDLQGEEVPYSPPAISRPEKNEDFNIGVVHGAVYGDGSKLTNVDGYIVILFGEKRQLAPYFNGISRSVRDCVRAGLPAVSCYRVVSGNRDLKALPSNDESDSYKYGFICGLIATDGNVSGSCVSIFSKSSEQLSGIMSIASSIGFSLTTPKLFREFSPYDGSFKPCYILRFIRRYFSTDDLIRSDQADNFSNNQEASSKNKYLRVLSVKSTGVEEDVYCAVEPVTQTFTIRSGILTRNCFVQPVGDSLLTEEGDEKPGIYNALAHAAKTMSKGGGVGYNFSAIRPKKSYVRGTQSHSSGPCSYLDTYNASGKTIESAGCFAGDTLIHTTQGLIPIKEIVESDQEYWVYTHLGPRKVTAKFSNGIKHIWEVETGYGYEVPTTPDHKYAQLSNGTIITRTVRDILQDRDQKVLIHVRSDIGELTPTYSDDEKFAYIAGAFAGNGTYKVRTPVEGSDLLTKGIAISNNSQTKWNIAEKIFTYLSDLGYNPIIRKREYENTVEVYAYSVERMQYWKDLGIIKGDDMVIPNFILRGNENIRAAYLAGVFEADGYTCESKSNIVLKMTADKFLKQVQILLGSIGVIVKRGISRPGMQNWKQLYCLGVYGPTAQNRFNSTVSKFMEVGLVNVSSRDRVGYSHSAEDVLGFGYIKNTFNRYWDGNFIKHPNISMSAITNVCTHKELTDTVSDYIYDARMVGVGPVYDLEVDEVHLLSGNSIYTSNSRRAAMMGVLNIDHPDIMEFVTAKQTPGRWDYFNVSVGVSEAFMQAVESDSNWELVHKEPPHPDFSEGTYQREDGKYVYEIITARDLFNEIMKSTYDFAEPGIIFLDTMNRENNLYYCETIDATNPCVTADTRLHTQYGMVRIGELFEKQLELQVTVDKRVLEDDYLSVTYSDELDALEGTDIRPAVKAFMTSPSASVFKVTTEAGYEIKATAWHEFYTQRGKIKLKDLLVGDDLLIQSGPGQFGNLGTYKLGFLLGYMAGDGYFTGEGDKEEAIVDFWDHKQEVCGLVMESINELLEDVGVEFGTNGRKYNLNVFDHEGGRKKTIGSVRLTRALAHYGFTKGTKTQVPEVVWQGSRDCVVGYLHGLFEADSTINSSDSKASCSIRLGSIVPSHLKEVQVLLSNFGIFSSIYLRRKATTKLMPDGRSGYKEYPCKDYYELIIDGESRDRYMSQICYALTEHADKYSTWRRDRKLGRQHKFTTKIASIEHFGTEAVYDTTQHDHHALIFGGIVTGNCSEQPLPDYGCCDLGPIILTQFVKNPFTAEAAFDLAKFNRVVALQVRMLDNVLDYTSWPLPEQKQEAMNKRRIGVGYTGIGDTLVMLNMRYGSEDATKFVETIARNMRDSAYQASVDLAKERGAFPLFDADMYLAGNFVSRLPEYIRGGILKFGIRNSHLLSIAPTGTVSLAFADNASNGIEPAFSWVYDRRKRESDGSWKPYKVMDHAFKRYISEVMPTMYTEECISKFVEAVSEGRTAFRMSHPEIGDYTHHVKEMLPESFVTALELNVDEHLSALFATQPYLCTSQSKTVNVPENYPFEDFCDIYMKAWKGGLKGVSTYRPNPVRPGILTAPTEKKVEEVKKDVVTPIVQEDIDLRDVAIGSLGEGDLPAIKTKKVMTINFEDQNIHIAVSFLNMKCTYKGADVEIMRPVEFFVPQSQIDESPQWVTSTMRTLSLLARQGVAFARALADNRNIRWDKGNVRCGTLIKSDGSVVPRFHSSDVAAISWVIQDLLIRAGYLDESGRVKSMAQLIKVVGASDAPKVESAVQETKAVVTDRKIIPGKTCQECGADAVIKVDGCQKCTSCGWQGSCG